MIAAIVAAAASLVTAALTYLLSQRGARRVLAHEARLQRVNAQLSQLYGPLLVMTESSLISFRVFKDVYDDANFSRRYRLDEPHELSPTQLEAWQHWLPGVFQKTNRQMYELLLTRGDLLVDGVMPDCMIQFCAHVTGYETILQRWESGDTRFAFSAVAYPPAFTPYLRDSYAKLAREQARLLAIIG